MRLIDADELIKIVDEEMNRIEEEMSDADRRPHLYTDDFRVNKSYVLSGMAHIAQDILEAPTAFDVDKVIEDLNQERDTYQKLAVEHFERGNNYLGALNQEYATAIGKAIETVKRGWK